ncbi:hypothetical protein CBS101457_005901 [Exobasidium rhododendri]|nr:hypothetical protein CBS101457_005901 [Exobasidium rhododendri]
MLKSFNKLMGGSSKKGKTKLQDGDDSIGPDDTEVSSSSASVAGQGSIGRSRATSDTSVPSNGKSRKGSGALSSLSQQNTNDSDRSQPVKIEKHGGLSKHESPLPSPSSSTANVNGADTSAVLNGGQEAESPTKSYNHRADAPSSVTPSPTTSMPAGNAVSDSPPNIPTTQTILANPSGSAPALSSSAGRGNGSTPGSGVANQRPVSSGGPANGSGSSADPVRTFNIDDMIARLLEAGYSTSKLPKPALKNAEITAVCTAAREVFLSQPTLIELSPPVKIVGDTHGQYQDLLRLFEMCGFPPQSNYLFLGDYVDRGKQSLETILLLLCYKIKYPENFFLLRGNHECANVTRVYGFYDECKRRVNIKIWKTFIDVFNTLPIAAVVASKIFCVHGGLSPSLSNMDDIRRIERPTDVPDYGLLNDLLWSDPSDTALDWEDNERGVSYCFGKAVIQQFLAQYDFDLICRAHMVVEDGYEFWNERTLVTIFSAPNYCGEFDNFGAVMSVSEDLLCAFELLKPLDGAALKKEMAKNKRRR